MRELIAVWNGFWHRPMDTLPLAALRVLTGILLFGSFVVHGISFETWIFGSAFFENQLMVSLYDQRAPYTFFRFVDSYWPALVVYFLHLIPALFFLLGVGGRWSSVGTYLAFCSLSNRNPSVLFGFDEYMATFLVVFLVNPGMDYLRIGNLFQRFQRPHRPTSTSATIAIRLFQVIFCFRYFAAGYYKPLAQWADGRILWEVFNNFEIWKIDLAFLHPLWNMFGLMSLSIKIFELFFIPLIFYPPTRNLAIVFGLSMHLGIGIFTPLMSFSLLMMAGYIVFVSPEFVRTMYGHLVIGLGIWRPTPSRSKHHTPERHPTGLDCKL